jgi:hypothetical protein
LPLRLQLVERAWRRRLLLVVWLEQRAKWLLGLLKAKT